MRAIVDLPDEQLAKLQALCTREGISRAEAVRRAITLFVDQAEPPDDRESRARVFGLWKDRKDFGADSVDWQRAIRGEWDRDDRS